MLQQGVPGDLTLQRFSEQGGFVLEATADFGSGSTLNDTFGKFGKLGKFDEPGSAKVAKIGCRVLLGDFDGDGQNEVL